MNKAILKLLISCLFLGLLPGHFWYITEICTRSPYAAFLPGITLLYFTPLVSSVRKSKIITFSFLTAVVGAGWIAYGFWEYKMYGMFSPLDIPIRIDILIIAPLLWIGSGFVLTGFFGEKTCCTLQKLHINEKRTK